MKVDLFGFKCWIVPVVLQTNSDIVREHGNTILGQKMKSFPLRISSVNVTKSAGNCGFGHIYRRNP